MIVMDFGAAGGGKSQYNSKYGQTGGWQSLAAGYTGGFASQPTGYENFMASAPKVQPRSQSLVPPSSGTNLPAIGGGYSGGGGSYTSTPLISSPQAGSVAGTAGAGVTNYGGIVSPTKRGLEGLGGLQNPVSDFGFGDSGKANIPGSQANYGTYPSHDQINRHLDQQDAVIGLHQRGQDLSEKQFGVASTMGKVQMGIQVAQGLWNAWMGYQNLQEAKKQNAFQRDAFTKNYNMQAQDYERRMERAAYYSQQAGGMSKDEATAFKEKNKVERLKNPDDK